MLDKLIMFRATEAEREELKSVAKSAGLTLTQYIRGKLFVCEKPVLAKPLTVSSKDKITHGGEMIPVKSVKPPKHDKPFVYRPKDNWK